MFTQLSLRGAVPRELTIDRDVTSVHKHRMNEHQDRGLTDVIILHPLYDHVVLSSQV